MPIQCARNLIMRVYWTTKGGEKGTRGQENIANNVKCILTCCIIQINLFSFGVEIGVG